MQTFISCVIISIFCLTLEKVALGTSENSGGQIPKYSYFPVEKALASKLISDLRGLKESCICAQLNSISLSAASEVEKFYFADTCATCSCDCKLPKFSSKSVALVYLLSYILLYFNILHIFRS